MFRRVLIANRGEIAVRIARAVHDLGLEAVAVYSEADKTALHVRRCDDSIAIGPAAPADSYLHIQRIVDAAKSKNCDAVHPGYGFLSENATFIRRCTDAGIAFIGPDAKAIEDMRDKVAARVALDAAGLPSVPGSGILESVDAALAEAERVGYPVMVKAAGGGGGIGMSRVENADQLRAGFETARARAEKAFADPRVYVEKFVENPHHVEVQILGDGQDAIHAFDRECSIQRRFQKVLEEARAPFAKTKHDEMTSIAAAAAKKVGYVNAGTIECLVSGSSGDWYFLEMNRRIQVEHPITEMITGLDLVKLQIEIAAKKKLPITQGDVSAKGHAIEMRLCAEDPFRFFPSPGEVKKWRVPDAEHVRIDAGVEEGSSVPMFYDPLLAKICVWGKTRDEAIARARKYVDDVHVEGVKTNLALHKAILDDPVFQSGDTPTSYLDDLIKRLKAEGTVK